MYESIVKAGHSTAKMPIRRGWRWMSALRRAKGGTYRIRCIHGCHGGTALRDMIRGEYARHPRVLRLEASADGGATGPGAAGAVRRDKNEKNLDRGPGADARDPG